MAVPKKRTGHSAQGKRRANWKASKPEVTVCPNCGQPVLAHTVCTACGYYKGKAVSIKSPDYVAEGEAKKKAPKKSTKAAKAEKVEEKEVSEEVVSEEKAPKATKKSTKAAKEADATEKPKKSSTKAKKTEE